MPGCSACSPPSVKPPAASTVSRISRLSCPQKVSPRRHHGATRLVHRCVPCCICCACCACACCGCLHARAACSVPPAGMQGGANRRCREHTAVFRLPCVVSLHENRDGGTRSKPPAADRRRCARPRPACRRPARRPQVLLALWTGRQVSAAPAREARCRRARAAAGELPAGPPPPRRRPPLLPLPLAAPRAVAP